MEIELKTAVTMAAYAGSGICIGIGAIGAACGPTPKAAPRRGATGIGREHRMRHATCWRARPPGLCPTSPT